MIKVQNLVKVFGTKRAVDDISFSIDRGEVLGFLGPNGAGKSTTMRMITGFLPPSGGSVSVGGFDIVEQPIQAKRLIGYLPENAPAYTDMTVHGFLNFAAEIRGLRGDARKKAVSRVVEMCFLESVLRQSVETLSKGYRHRTCFAQSIIHDPDVLVLDEPTDGLDPNQKHEVRTLIQRMAPDKAIIISTHLLEEVKAICTRAVIIDRGRVVADGTPAELVARSRHHNAVTLSLPQAQAEIAKTKIKALNGVAAVEQTTLANGLVELTAFPKGGVLLVEDISALVVAEKWDVKELYAEAGRLDDVFRAITTHDADRARESRA